MTSTSGNTNARLGRLEQVTSRLEVKAEGTDHKIDEQAKILSTINAKLDRRTETSWPVVISSVALAATIGTLALSPVNEKLADLKQAQIHHIDLFYKHTETEGHRPMMIRVEALEKAVNRTREELKHEIGDVEDDSRFRDQVVDEVVQREMRILDQAMQERFDKEDERLQREMDLKDDIVIKQSEAQHEKAMGLLKAIIERINKFEKVPNQK